VKLGFSIGLMKPPFLTGGTPAIVKRVMDYLNGCKRGNIDDLSHSGQFTIGEVIRYLIKFLV
jgi:hypothetical protein